MGRPTLNNLDQRVTALETQMETSMATLQEILDVTTQLSGQLTDVNTALDAIQTKLAGQISQAEATQIRDTLTTAVATATAIVAKAQQLAG